MPWFQVTYKVVEYMTTTVMAKNKKEAEKIADEMDGDCFVSCSDPEWELLTKETEKVQEE
jgi:hypothetical protein